MRIEEQLLNGCRRLAAKGVLQSPCDSFSVRTPGQDSMIFVSGLQNWQQVDIHNVSSISLHAASAPSALHAAIYNARGDAGAITLGSPRGVRLLAGFGGVLPTLFDEQARHIGAPVRPIAASTASIAELSRAFANGHNALLLGKQLLCLGMTCERVLLNAELFEKCAQAYVIACASGQNIGRIPWWVRLIAKRRLLRDEREAALSYRNGLVPENIGGY